jgi:hypothetical protein|tara:strand:+ start:257 stop:1489 length:1233 start_codon:yes stop_codon:yes gene_type:complete
MNIMRPLVGLGLILILSSPIAMAATITVVASKDQYNPGDALVILGTATPGSAVAIQVYNPVGILVGIDQSDIREDSQYVVEVFNFPENPTTEIPFGTYRVRAVDAATSESAEITIEFAQSTSPPVIPKEDLPAQPLILQINVRTSSTYQLGDEVRVVVLFSYNGSEVDPTVKTASVYLPRVGEFEPEIVSLMTINTGLYYFDYTPDEIGTYVVQVEGTANETSNVEVATFYITERLASESNLDDVENTIVDRISLAQSDIVNDINDDISVVQNNVNNLEEKMNSLQTIMEETVLSARNVLETEISSAVIDLSGQISSAKSDMESNIGSQIELSEENVVSSIDGLQTIVTTSAQTMSSDLNQATDAVDTMKTNLDSVSTGVSSASVWIMIVGLIALITLTLELVMFVRKIS